MPFYNAETDAIDFKQLEQYICNLRMWRANHRNKECETCFYHDVVDRNLDQLHAIPSYAFELKSEDMDYHARTELEHLRELFKLLTDEEDYYYTSDFNNLKDIVVDYREQYRNLDETISNFENKIYQKNKEIERLQTLLDEKPVKEVVKVIEKEPVKDNRPVTRSSKIYNKFKLNVLKRDEVCQCCGSTENLHVHHISSYKHDKERRADTHNGIVLCKDCHSQFHSLYGKGHKNNPVNFAKFMREYGKPMQVNLDYVAGEENIFEEILGGK
jgi:5-methylcytosine-specific restriction endonuclease McrA